MKVLLCYGVALGVAVAYNNVLGFSLIGVLCLLMAVHFLISFVYHFCRTRNIFLDYYSEKVLSTPGPLVYEVPQSPDNNVNREKFTKTLEQLKEEVKNKESHGKTWKQSQHSKAACGLYHPDDKVMEVGRESAAFFGGGRAVFLQLAHPYVASGVKHHSKAADDIQRRFYNTFHHMFRLTFGDLEVAEKSAKQVRFIHDKVNGTLHPSPPYTEGSKYSANHQGALIWVWATLADTSALMYELLVRRLAIEEKEEYYEGQKQFVRYFGVEASEVPDDWESFMEYNAKMWNSEILAVSDTARMNDEALFRPHNFLAKYSNKLTRRVTFALLPPRIAEGFHVHLGWYDYFVLYSFFGLSRMIYSSLPPSLRYLTAYLELDKRVRGHSVYNETLSSFSAWAAGLVLRNVIMGKVTHKNPFNNSATKEIDSTSIVVK